MAEKELRQYVLVAFKSPEEAKAALDSTLSNFSGSTLLIDDFSRCEGNVVYLHVHSCQDPSAMKDFLLRQHGAIEEGHIVRQ